MRLSAARSEAGEDLPLGGTLKAITDYWAQQFAGVEAGPQACWRRSAPGPDGLTYLASSKVGAPAEHVVWAVTQSTMARDPVPYWVIVALMVALPKWMDDSGDAERWTSSRPTVATLPNMLSKCDTQTVPKCLDTTLRRLPEQVFTEEQRGFCQGRAMHDNLLSLWVAMEAFAHDNRPETTAQQNNSISDSAAQPTQHRQRRLWQ